MNFINVKNLCKKSSDNKLLLDNINFSVSGNDEIAVITGNDKDNASLLMKIMAGLVKPDSGAVLFNDNNITEMSNRDSAKFRCKELGYVPRKSNLVPILNVGDNINLPNHLANNKPDDITVCVGSMAIFGKGSDGSIFFRNIDSLSNSETKRVMLLRTIYQRPRFVLLDDISNNINDNDIKLIFNAIALFEYCPIIIASNDPRIISAASKIYNLKNGKLTLIKNNNEDPNWDNWLKTKKINMKLMDGTVKTINLGITNN